MRWTFNCILLASIAVISASETTSEDDARDKRDLTFMKNLISGALLGTEETSESPKILVKETDDYKLFRIPGFEKILVKATPKRTIAVEAAPSHTAVDVSGSVVSAANPNIAIVNSYLGTTTLNETMLALQGVKNLLQSGVLEARRERVDYVKPASYPSVIIKPGKIIVDGVEQTVVKQPLPIPMIEGYRPVQVTRLPDLPIPTKYSYNQVSSGGIMSFTAKDNKNVIVSETNKPEPLPSYLTSRIQEVLYLGAQRVPRPVVPVIAAGVNIPPPPIPIYKVPKVSSSPVKVMPTLVSSVNSYSHVHQPAVFLTPPPVEVAIPNVPSSYSYSHVHNDGSVTSYSGSGKVDRKGERPPIVVAEVSKPAPLPVFLTNRIEKVAATAMVARVPNAVPHVIYPGPVVIPEPRPVIVEKRPTYVYDHVNHLPPGVNPHLKPIYKDDVNIHITKHERPAALNVPSRYSYQSVHADGSVSTYSDAGVTEEGKQVLIRDGPMLHPASFPGPYNFHHVYPHIVKEEICLEPPFAHHPNINGHVHSVHSRPGGYSYKTVHGDGLQTTYSGSGHVEHQNVANPLISSIDHPAPPVMVPEVVSPGEFFVEDFDGGKKVMVAQPVISQYVYKQINHHSPNDITVADMGPMPLNGEVNVKVGAMPVPNGTPSQYLSPPPAPELPVLPSVTPKGPNEYVYVPPTDVDVPLPTRKPPVPESGTQSGHSFTHVTSDGVHTHKDGKATFESSSSAPVVKIVKSSSSTTSKKRVKVVRGGSTSRARTTTAAPTTAVNFSANPIIVAEEPTFSFKQDRSDGSSITVVGNKENVSVIEDRTESEYHRGDIPNTSL